jgi:hypothetical protein
VDDLTWEAHPLGEENDSPWLCTEGEYDGREVWPRVLAYPPEGEGPAMKFDANRG